MCVIIGMDKAKMSLKTLQEYEDVNSDGGGIAWIDKKEKKVCWCKGIDAAQIYEIVTAMPLPMVVHFRIATAGGVDKELCHPFPIEPNVSVALAGSASKVLFHNGHMLNWEDDAIATMEKTGSIIPDGPWSDTRAIAWINAVNDKGLIHKLVPMAGKFMILTTNGISRFGEGWTKYEDCWVSNRYTDSYGYTGYYGGYKYNHYTPKKVNTYKTYRPSVTGKHYFIDHYDTKTGDLLYSTLEKTDDEENIEMLIAEANDSIDLSVREDPEWKTCVDECYTCKTRDCLACYDTERWAEERYYGGV